MSMGKALHQMSASAERVAAGDGEAVVEAISDEARPTWHDTVSAGPGLLAQALARENMQRAWKRVKANVIVIFERLLSEHSHGFRPGRRARDAVLATQRYVQQGYRVVVDVDLEKFFDRVKHDVLIDRLQKRIGDAGAIALPAMPTTAMCMCAAGKLANG